jgi:acyl CoA:acetate/3-ketoacid CoA transferase alpha subunit
MIVKTADKNGNAMIRASTECVRYTDKTTFRAAKKRVLAKPAELPSKLAEQ